MQEITNSIRAKETRLQWLYFLMFVINFTMIGFLSIIMYITTNEICSDYEARSFLETAKYLPLIPWQIPTYSLGFLALMALTTFARYILWQYQRQWAIISLYMFDIVLCSLITYYVNFSYKGLFLLVIASIFLYVTAIGARVFLLVFAMAVFIMMDYDLLTVRMNVVSLQDYLNYYSEGTRISLFAIKNLLDSFNQIAFILFFSLLIQSKIRENKEYIRLNNTLQEKVEELKIANEKLEIFTRESIAMAKIKERNRLAREIHDILGHSLTSITTGIEASMALLDIDKDVAKNQMKKIRDVARKGLVDVRRSVRELKIDAVEKYALIPAIKKLVEEVSGMSDVKIDLQIVGEIMSMQDDEEQTIYRIIQESITNSIRHGQASHIDVLLEFKYHDLLMRIQDNGSGCDMIEKGFGLTHIEERIKMLGGAVKFESGKDQGFCMEAEVPVRWGKAYD
ncbi:MAG: hypothetical protein PWP10_4056 [Clostridiales bacterium]|jgi:signal transduction histidine kinase|nr:hypothetical protein [Clostridiales bacterium]